MITYLHIQCILGVSTSTSFVRTGEKNGLLSLPFSLCCAFLFCLFCPSLSSPLSYFLSSISTPFPKTNVATYAEVFPCRWCCILVLSTRLLFPIVSAIVPVCFVVCITFLLLHRQHSCPRAYIQGLELRPGLMLQAIWIGGAAYRGTGPLHFPPAAFQENRGDQFLYMPSLLSTFCSDQARCRVPPSPLPPVAVGDAFRMESGEGTGKCVINQLLPCLTE